MTQNVRDVAPSRALRRLSLLVGLLPTLALAACILPKVERTGPPPSSEQLAEFWVEPPPAPRNLYDGPLFDGIKPVSDARYEILERDPRGFSITYHVRDDHGREWN